MKFYAKTQVLESGCIRWTGAINKSSGYGMFRHEGRVRSAHGVLYEVMEGILKPGLTLDHTCRNRWCVNLSHLEPVTQQENVLRGEATTQGGTHANARHSRAMYERRVAEIESGGTVVPSCGHELSIVRDIVKGSGGCRYCHNDQVRRRSQRDYGQGRWHYNKEK